MPCLEAKEMMLRDDGLFCCSVIVSVSQTVARAEPPSDRRRGARNARAAAAVVRGALTQKRSDLGNLTFLFCLRIVT